MKADRPMQHKMLEANMNTKHILLCNINHKVVAAVSLHEQIHFWKHV